jgi:hypothetical protein
MSEVRHRVLETLNCGEGTVLVLVLDQHERAGVDAARMSWWVGTPDDGPDDRITVLEAIELMIAHMLSPPLGPGGAVTEEDLRTEAGESVLRVSFDWLARPIVSPTPDLGGAARPFWKELVEAIGKHPAAAALLIHELEDYILRKRERGQGGD